MKKDKIREHRIDMEIIVDAYHEEERAMGWYYYLEDNLAFQFKAKCTAKRSVSPLKVGEIVEVTGMAPEEECMHEMFVEIQWGTKIGSKWFQQRTSKDYFSRQYMSCILLTRTALFDYK